MVLVGSHLNKDFTRKTLASKRPIQVVATQVRAFLTTSGQHVGSTRQDFEQQASELQAAVIRTSRGTLR